LVLDIPAQKVRWVQDKEDIVFHEVKGTFWEYLAFNHRAPPLNQRLVRQAIAWALDREEIIKAVKLGWAMPLFGGLLPPHHWAYHAIQKFGNPKTEQARAYLKEAGFDFSSTLEIIVGSDFFYQVNAAQVIKYQLSKIGIDVKVSPIETVHFFERLNNGDFQMSVVGWLGFVDPDEWFYSLFHSKGPWNQQGYQNKEVDALLEQGRVELDLKKRKAIYKKIQKHLLEDLPMAFLYLNPSLSAHLNHVHGFIADATLTTLSFEQVYLGDKEND